jgi:hypothetical protein
MSIIENKKRLSHLIEKANALLGALLDVGQPFDDEWPRGAFFGSIQNCQGQFKIREIILKLQTQRMLWRHVHTSMYG